MIRRVCGVWLNVGLRSWGEVGDRDILSWDFGREWEFLEWRFRGKLWVLEFW